MKLCGELGGYPQSPPPPFWTLAPCKSFQFLVGSGVQFCFWPGGMWFTVPHFSAAGVDGESWEVSLLVVVVVGLYPKPQRPGLYPRVSSLKNSACQAGGGVLGDEEWGEAAQTTSLWASCFSL